MERKCINNNNSHKKRVENDAKRIGLLQAKLLGFLIQLTQNQIENLKGN